MSHPSTGAAEPRPKLELMEEYYGTHYHSMLVADELADWALSQPEYSATEKMLTILRASGDRYWGYLLGLFHEEEGFPEPTERQRP